MGLKRKPLRSQLHSGFLENVSGFKYQRLWLRVLGWSDQQRLGEQLPSDAGGRRTSLAMLWTLALPTPTLRRQTRQLQDLLAGVPGLQRGLPIGHRAVLTMQELALLPVRPREDGIVTV